MLLSLSFVLLLSAGDPELDAAAHRFVAAIASDDATALPASTPLALGHAADMLEYLDDTSVHSWCISAAERRDEATVVLLELDASATAIGNGARVDWPRWWSLELKDGKLVSAMTLERRLAGQVLFAPPEQLAAAAEAARDVEAFLVYLVEAAAEHNDGGCRTILWALAEGQRRGIVRAETSALRRLAVISMRKWDGRSAVPPAERAVRLAGLDGRPEVVSETLFSRGVSYWAANRTDEAVASLRRAGELASQVEDPRQPMRAMYMAAHLELRRNRLRESLAIAEVHREMAERYRWLNALMDSAFHFWVLHNRIGNQDVAWIHGERALALARQTGDRRSEAMAIYNIGVREFNEGNYARAGRLLRQAMSMSEMYAGSDGVVTMRLTIAAIDDFEGAHESAMTAIDAVIAAAHGQPGERESLTTAYALRSASHLRQGRPEQALADARRSRAYAGRAGSSARIATADPEIQALSAEADALRELSHVDSATALWRAVIELVELDLNERGLDETGSSKVMEAKLTAYRRLLELLAEQGCARDALVIAERMRARSLRRTLRHGSVDFSAGLDASERASKRAIEQQIAAVNRALLSAAPDEVTRLRGERDAARLALQRFRGERTIAHAVRRERVEELEEWQPIVGPDEVVLELAVSDNALFLFVLHGTRIDLHRLAVPQDELETRVNAFVSAIEQRDLAYRRLARELYDLLLAPAAAQLATARVVRIIPDGVLWRLPFHALIDERGRHLIDRMDVSYSPSLALSRGTVAAPAPRTLLALADPAIRSTTAAATRSMYRDVSLGRLPEAAVEARTIARLYRDSEVLVGAEARERAFKEEATTYRVLHLATHSIVDDGAPLYSSIVLASADGEPLEDGLLEAREIAEMKLNADLVVLSACETARGSVATGEGMIGLNWAFLSAGVPTTVVSQWKVGSASTAELMIAFHRRLRAGSTPAAALRAAALTLRRDPRWQHPFYWAPFVVIENPGTRQATAAAP